jgi:hypothetical protein
MRTSAEPTSWNVSFNVYTSRSFLRLFLSFSIIDRLVFRFLTLSMNNSMARSVLFLMYNKRMIGEPKWNSVNFILLVPYLSMKNIIDSFVYMMYRTVYFLNAWITAWISLSLSAMSIILRKSSVNIWPSDCWIEFMKFVLKLSEMNSIDAFNIEQTTTSTNE